MYFCTDITKWSNGDKATIEKDINQSYYFEMTEEQYDVLYRYNVGCLDKFFDYNDYHITFEKVKEIKDLDKALNPIIKEILEYANNLLIKINNECVFYDYDKKIFSVNHKIDYFPIPKLNIMIDETNRYEEGYIPVMTMEIVHDYSRPCGNTMALIYYTKDNKPTEEDDYVSNLWLKHPVLIRDYNERLKDKQEDDEDYEYSIKNLGRLIDPYDYMLYANIEIDNNIVDIIKQTPNYGKELCNYD